MFQLRWVWKQMDGFRKRYIFALCSTVLLSVMALGNSMITSVIMDTVFQPLVDTGVVTEQAFDHLIFLVAVLIGFTLFRTGFQYLSIMTYEGCSQKLVFKLRRDLYKNMQEQDQAFFSKTRTGDLMTRLTGDLDMVRFAVAWVVRQLIDCTVLFVTTSVVFLATDWLFALSMLAVRPSILILDDTTSAVDLETEKYIQEQLSNLDFSCTKIIVAQRISTTKRADKIVILDKGCIVDVGTHEELSQRPGYYREVFLLQNGMDQEKEVV